MSDTALFLLFMIPGTFFLGAYDVLVRKILKGTELAPQFLLGINFVFGGLLYFAVLFFIGFPPLLSGFWFAVIATIILNVFGQWAWYAAFKREEASLVSPLRLLTPPLVIVTGIFILSETPTILGIGGILLTVVGLWMFMRSEARFSQENILKTFKRPGVLLALFGSLVFAFSFAFDKQSVTTSSPFMHGALVFFTVGVVSLLIYLSRRKPGEQSFVILKTHLPAILFITLIHAAGSILTFFGLQFALAAYAASVKRLWSLWAVILGGALLREKNTARRLVATLIMLSGIVLTVVLG